ncbi:YHYH protein [Chitinophagaceae bacterium MMS25-I14]
MKKLLLGILLLKAFSANSQAIINSWILNANGKLASYWASSGQPPTYTFVNTTDSADVLKICYNADTVWMRSLNMTDNMGKYMNPGTCVAQNWVHRFPRNPTVPVTKTVSPKIGEIGMLINGIAIYGLSNANSWSGTANANPQAGGQGVWNVEVGKSEGFVLDTAFGAHPQQGGVYHSHTTPYRLYKNTPTSKHSPLIGWAFDGYPIYGPYGYSSAMDSTSTVIRMKSGYSLRNITTRTTLPGGAAASQPGPAVNSTYPIGTYCEDYEWLAANGGDLDAYNGRMCVTPEFPQGTYAYFVTIDAAGNAQFPYYIGIDYYGQPDIKNFPQGPAGNGLSMPAGVTSCHTPVSTGVGQISGNDADIKVYPNPAANGAFTIKGNNHRYTQVTVVNALGQVVYRAAINGNSDHRIQLNTAGVYFVRCDDAAGSPAEVVTMIVK